MSAKYLLRCSCGQQVAVESVQAGQRLACSCGKSLEVPTMREMARLPRAEEVEDPKAFLRVGWRHILGVFGGLLLIAGLAVGIHRAGRSLAPPAMANYPPAMVWIAWQDLRLGVDRGLAPDQIAHRQAQQTHARLGWLTAGLVVAGLAALGISVALILAHRRRST